MPSPKTALVATIKGYDGFIIEIKLNHSEGGLNHYDHRSEPAGYYVHANPAIVEGVFVSFMLGSGAKTLVEPASRLDPEKLTTIAAKGSSIPGLERIYKKVVEGYPERGYPTWDKAREQAIRIKALV